MEYDIRNKFAEILKEKDVNIRLENLFKLSYENRYVEPILSFEIAEKAHGLALEIKNEEAVAIAKMHMAFAKFLKSDDYPILQQLIEANNVLLKTKRLPEYPILLNYLGNVYESYGEYQTALQYSQDSLRMAKENDLKETESDSHSIIGTIFTRLSDTAGAIKHFENSLHLREGMGNMHAVASSLNLLARTFSMDCQFEKSAEYYQKAIELRKSIGDKGALPWSYLGLASLYEKQRKFDEAVDYYLLSVELNKESGDKRCKLHCFFGLARIYFDNGNIDNTLKYIDETIKIATDLNAKPILFEVHALLAEYYEKTGDTQRAYQHYKLFHSIKEEVLNSQMHNKLKNQQVSFEVEKSQKEAEIYHLKNVELKKAFQQIEKKNGEILDSITYAKNIQNAVMLPVTYLKNSLEEYFILFKPRDIVSGDFYWSLETETKIFIAAADCTGHGVPGAFMSMLGMTFINEIVQNNLNATASEVLNLLRTRVISALRQSDDMSGSKDGMDISFCILHKYKNVLEYSGAYNPLYIFENNELREIKANRMPIGHHPLMHQNFENHFIETKKGMCFYMFSDGYADQFGGEEGKKFMSKNLKSLLLQIHNKPMADQRNILDKTIRTWMSGHSQTDDILLIGFRV